MPRLCPALRQVKSVLSASLVATWITFWKLYVTLFKPKDFFSKMHVTQTKNVYNSKNNITPLFNLFVRAVDLKLFTE